jgi:WD40 repeat protein
MLNKMMLPAILLTLPMGFVQTSALGADELPPRALARLGDHRFYHGPGIACAVLSPDGRCIASAARFPSYFRHIPDEYRDPYERTIVLWDAATGKRIRELRVPHGPVARLAFSPDGKHLAAAGGSFGFLFDVESGKLVRRLAKLDTRVDHLAFSADGKQLRVSEHEGAVTSCDVQTGKQRRRWQPPVVSSELVKADVRVTRGELSPQGKLIAWRLCQLPDYNKLPRATVLVVTDAGTEKPLYGQMFKVGALDSLTFSHDGRRLVIASDKLSVRDAATGKELFALDAPSPYRFALSPDGRQAAIADDKSRVRLWDLGTRKPSHEICSGLVYINSDILGTPQAFSADGKTLLLATHTTLRLFDTMTGKERAEPGHRAPVTPRFSPDGRTLFTSCGEVRCRWDLSPGKEPALLSHERRNAWEGICGEKALAHSGDGRLFLDGSGANVRLREVATGRVVRALEGARWAFLGLFSPDATRVLLWHSAVTGQDGQRVRLYDARTGKRSGEIEIGDRAGYPVFSPDGRFVAWADCLHAVRLHDAVTGKLVRTLRSSRPLPRPDCNTADLFFSPSGELLIVSDYFHESFSRLEDIEKWNTLPVRVFHVPSGREISRFHANPEKTSRAGRLACAACSPDGRLLAVGEEESGTIRLIEIASGRVRVELTGHRHGVRRLAFSPDGKALASGGEDNVVLLWDVTGARTGAAVKGASERELTAWWADLAGEDAQRAGAAVASLIRTPGQSVAFLKDRLHPAEAQDEKRLARLIAEFDAGSFQKRDAANRELARLGEQAEPALRRALKNGPPLEVSRRIETLLERLERGPLPPETMRALRAIEVLEHVGTLETRRCLEALAKGTEARQTRDAKAALDRLARRR